MAPVWVCDVWITGLNFTAWGDLFYGTFMKGIWFGLVSNGVFFHGVWSFVQYGGYLQFMFEMGTQSLYQGLLNYFV